MQLSSRIIKHDHIEYDDIGVAVADIRLEDNLESNIVEVKTSYVQDKVVDTVDIDVMRNEITKKLYIENEHVLQQLQKKREQEAKIEAEKLKEKAREEAEKLKEKAKEEGLKIGIREGYEKGIKDSQIEANEIKNSAISLIKQSEKQVKEYFAENQNNIIRLAGDMAESIVHSTIDLSSDNILMIIKPIIQLYEKNENIIITCHPSNSTLLKSKLDQLKEIQPNSRFTILEDNNLEENGCIIENENQIIDLQIKKQINSIIKDLYNLED